MEVPEADALEADESGDDREQPACAGQVIPIVADDQEERRAEEQYAEGPEDESHPARAGGFFGIAGEDLVPLAGLQDALFVPELGFLRQPFAETLGEGHGGRMVHPGVQGEGEGGRGYR